jgi:hypothetical protein
VQLAEVQRPYQAQEFMKNSSKITMKISQPPPALAGGG